VDVHLVQAAKEHDGSAGVFNHSVGSFPLNVAATLFRFSNRALLNFLSAEMGKI